MHTLEKKTEEQMLILVTRVGGGLSKARLLSAI